ncbi:MAG: YciI family protein [Alphaproteobacteria bacterium]|nr:YciI family protein [Alphaproteobacteria bacterium]
MADQGEGQGGRSRPQYYVFWMTNVDPAPDPGKPVDDIRQEHFAYLSDLEERGILLAAGPFMDADGSRHGAGMMILRAGSMEEADAIAAEEPYRKYGLRNHGPTPWQWAEGSVTQTVRLKARTFEVT